MTKPAAAELRDRIVAALGDGELRRLSPGLDTTVAIVVGGERFRLVFREGEVALDEAGDAALALSAPETAWQQVLAVPPPPRYHAFTALQLVNAEFAFDGQPEAWAQARPALERIFELVVRTPPAERAAVARDLGQIEGRYRTIGIDGVDHDVYWEEAGQGVPVLFLHTAGADGRQFLGQLADTGLASRFRMIAVDMPFHGRSMPPRSWSGAPYRLTTEIYRGWCSAVIEQIVGEAAIVVGGSMGAAMAMVLAADRPHQLRGIVAVEPPYRSKGRRNPYQNHVGVHGALHNSSFVRGLMSPTSPQADRRRASWIYAQGAPGIYPGDLAFYSDEFDGAVVAPRIDGRRTPVALLCGTYDYSATPDDGARLAAAIPGSLFLTMDGLGHFPMCEDPDRFRPYLVQGLDFVLGAAPR